MNQPNLPALPALYPARPDPTAEQPPSSWPSTRCAGRRQRRRRQDHHAGLRIGEALARNLPPEQILALTFTPEAREVLRRRLLELGVARALVQRIAVLTFEDFARGCWMPSMATRYATTTMRACSKACAASHGLRRRALRRQLDGWTAHPQWRWPSSSTCSAT
jgi:hypothetical protein